ncbi:MAG: hypothetical protein QGH39_11885 [Candidatus Thermoplasmatota archaeon]|nr:hypothetical protein [Candidatus Thermoplasmatota archaeon]MDP7266246.1 hypothetical protein [Candidatus Thermoplasmatota archaeon]
MEKEEVEEIEVPKLELKAKTSRIKGQPGLVRVHESLVEDVDFNAGDKVFMCTPEIDKGVIVKLNADKFIPTDVASIRKRDMDKLNIQDGDTVIIKNYKKYTESLKDGYQKIKDKIIRKKDVEETEEDEEENKE